MPPRKTVCACLCVVAGLASPSAAQERRSTLLDVPFVAQTEALCGGAAAAMVLRYWGATRVYAEDFAALVDESAEGIKVGTLSSAIVERGWRALPVSATAADVRIHLARGRPIITLIEDRPGRHHYVVLVAWTENRVVYHDPSAGPFRVLDAAKFQRAWAATEHTSLLVLPGPETVDRDASVAAPSNEEDACSNAIEAAVGVARAGDLATAERLLHHVAETCPRPGAAQRELAGIRFLQRRWAEASTLAAAAVASDGNDQHAWQLLASSRFLQGDETGALDAWNRRQEPRYDLARIDGLGRTRHEVVANLLALNPDDVLTASKLARARRRLAALPGLQSSRVSYTPGADGVATVDVAVLERPVVATQWPRMLVMGAHAAIAREVRFDVANAMGNGERWTTSWRWWRERPRVAVSVAAPQMWRWAGLWRVEAAWERQLYLVADRAAATSGERKTISERRQAGLSFGDWASAALRWQVRGGLDRWANRGTYATAGGAIERRLLADRVAIHGEGTVWREVRGSGETFGSSSVSMAWRSNPAPRSTWTTSAGLHHVDTSAPLDLWPAVDTGHARPLLLRAHPLLHRGAIRSADLSRLLAHATVERQQPLAINLPASLSWAVFVDAANQFAAGPAPASISIDVGAGLRIGLPGTPDVIRMDLARGLRDGRVAFSIGWSTAWPGW
jgi:hypothetical protein